MSPDQVVFALAVQVAETMVERDQARGEAAQLRAELEQMRAAAAAVAVPSTP